MTQPLIAIIFDFDDTLGWDTISFLLVQHRLDPQKFWDESKNWVREGFDPPLAYLNLLLKYAREQKVDLSKQNLKKVGGKIPLFPGLPKALLELKEFTLKNPSLKEARVGLEFYIVSGGLEEMIRGNPIAKFMEGIFACNFAYDKKTGLPTALKSAVSFTEKTRFVFAVNKGISGEAKKDPYRINDAVPKEQRRIPWEQMIYIGDGPSDIPCLSLITKNGGTGIGVSAPTHTFRKGYELARGKRITVGPYTANYTKGSDMRKVLEETILRIGLEIAENMRMGVVSAPSHSSRES